MIERLIFGCGHLTGGASRAHALRIVARCLEVGLRHFDTAPLYGLGTAEGMLGEALRRDGRGALIHAKVGLPRPRYGMLKSYLRLAKRGMTKRRVLPEAGHLLSPGTDSAFPRGHFETSEMSLSFEKTLCELGQSRVQALLLHEAYSNNTSPKALAFLHEVQTRGEALEVGVANSAPFDSSLANLLPAGFLLQAAAPIEFLDGAERDLAGKIILHTIIKSFSTKRAADQQFSLAVQESCHRFEKLLGTGQGAEIALSYLLVGAAAPRAKLIYATSDEKRLDAFLGTMRAIEHENTGKEIVDFFRETYRVRRTQSAH